MPDGQEALVNDLIAKLKSHKVEGSRATARLTAELLRTVISLQKLPHAGQATLLIETVKNLGVKLIAANPVELCVGNIVRRVLRIIREEDLSLTGTDLGELNLLSESEDDAISQQDYNTLPAATAAAATVRSSLRAPSLRTLLEGVSSSGAHCNLHSSEKDSEDKCSYDKSARSRKLKHAIIEAINLLIDDIDSCHVQIAEQAIELIHHNEVILTLGHSKTVKEFLCTAKEKKRTFRVFIAEGAPRFQGHALAKELARRGLQTTVITDAAIFAMISRANMVIVGVHALMANGGVIAPVGMHMVALAARRHAVPFVALAGIHKLCPLYPHNPEVILNDMKSPAELLEFEEFTDCVDFAKGVDTSLLHVVNPAFDYVPPELVSLLITDIGGYDPSYMHRLITDFYSADDFVLQVKQVS